MLYYLLLLILLAAWDLAADACCACEHKCKTEWYSGFADSSTFPSFLSSSTFWGCRGPLGWGAQRRCYGSQHRRGRTSPSGLLSPHGRVLAQRGLAGDSLELPSLCAGGSSLAASTHHPPPQSSQMRLFALLFCNALLRFAGKFVWGKLGESWEIRTVSNAIRAIKLKNIPLAASLLYSVSLFLEPCAS